MATFNIFNFIMLIGGLAFFLFGMNVMSGSLEKMAGGKLELMLKKMTANPFISLVLGATITIAVQSSSATTVMLVGLVNSGIMQFRQTIPVIFGANIGTTLTSWILSLNQLEGSVIIKLLKPENFSLVLALIGVIMTMLCKSDKKKSIGTIFVGFAVLIFGMELMGDAVAPLGQMPEFRELLVKFNNPVIGLLFGAILTAIIQSSAASVAMLQSLSVTPGVNITFGMAIPIIMGQNIGTCVTSLISSIGTNTKAKRVAVVHLAVNILGTLVLLPLFIILSNIFEWAFINGSVDSFKIALVHTIFNMALTFMLMPFTKLLARIAEFIVKEKETDISFQDTLLLDDRLLRSPSVAISECNNITNTVCDLAHNHLESAMGLLKEYNEDEYTSIIETENTIDTYEDKLGTYLVKLSTMSLSRKDSQLVSKMLHAIGDFERLGDHAVNIAKSAKEINEKGVTFSDAAEKEISVLAQAVSEILDLTCEAYLQHDISIAEKVEPLEEVVDDIAAQIKHNHIERLQGGYCTIEYGFILSDLLNDFERISDHCSNIAVAVIEVAHDSFDTHKYLNNIKFGNSDFNSYYEVYSKKYSI